VLKILQKFVLKYTENIQKKVYKNALNRIYCQLNNKLKIIKTVLYLHTQIAFTPVQT